MALHPMGVGWRELLVATQLGVAAELDHPIEIEPGTFADLARFLDLTVEWGRRMDLTAARNNEELVDLVVADALVLASSNPAGTWVDVGSGGGAPAIPLALLCPNLELTLVEPRAKRVAFLRSALGTLNRTDVRVERQRSDRLTDGEWQTAVSRATLAPLDWLREGSRLATRHVWILLARGDEPEQPGWRVGQRVRYYWPLTGALRTAVRYDKHIR